MTSRQKRLRKKYVCHTERSEESLCALDLNRREILRFAQNDTKTDFFRSLFSLWGSAKGPRPPASAKIHVPARTYIPAKINSTPTDCSLCYLFAQCRLFEFHRPLRRSVTRYQQDRERSG